MNIGVENQLRSLMEKDIDIPTLIEDMVPEYMDSYLLCAARYGQTELVRYILEKDVCAAGVYARSALNIAVRRGHVEICRLLMEYGVYAGGDIQIAFHEAVFGFGFRENIRLKHKECIHILIDFGAGEFIQAKTMVPDCILDYINTRKNIRRTAILFMLMQQRHGFKNTCRDMVTHIAKHVWSMRK
ncbi:MAG: hypothetical protein DRI46_12780 [Chloroflexi bacterium]|nr:MAG: hypothetical protein DRI46_12780 [Chloroflexota bacterium]